MVRPRAVLLVRNGVSHDARVQRAAAVLHDRGFAVETLGAITAAAPSATEAIGPSTVRRLRARSPMGALRRAGLDPLPPPLAACHRTATALDWNRRAAGRLLRARPALIHANDYNTIWPALLARRLTGARVVYDSHELWADRNGRPEWRRWLLTAERHFVRTADAVITASPGYADELAARYGIARPTVVRNIPDDAAPLGRPVRQDEAVYVGGLMPGRGLEPVITALPDVPGLRLRLVGDGRPAYLEALRALARAAGVEDRVVFAGPVPAPAVVSEATGAAFGICLIEPICRSYELTLPNKLFEYARAGLPMLAGTTTPTLAQVVREGRLGTLADPADPATIAAALRLLADPEHNALLRKDVAAFAERETWAREREVLGAVYDALG